ncbi:hypothetical protein HBN65_20830 [Pseudomonas lundensis]|uniref:DUF4376 domain-containing protein n=1 Tax=Pseudomonas lundensis TaxID=86185 RepID=UPI0014740721|nr:hypothetical protein [Pseudomonas lundensis]NNA09217.1 hypothetical protein [Pseudomonas lundensis]
MARYFYSPSLHTFLVDGVHKSRPADCVAITNQEYTALLQHQAAGSEITFDSELMKPVAREAEQLSENERLAASHLDKTTQINLACESAITAGFWSSALGEPFQYASQLDDQLNLTGVIQTGLDSLYACRDQVGTKLFRPHTAEQLRHVGSDFSGFKQQLLQKANGLKQILDQALADSDLAVLQSVTWEGVQ